MNKANETAWLVIAIICSLAAIYFALALGINNQDTLVLGLAAIVSVVMYNMRRTKRLKAEKK